ncbi:ABC1 family-domain-containing protein [Scenedesmus sp. NREL 46B-D3]|nr:ABC1 family-domain-containing protein [Scenedesmus sp. NREL 46B-D3]
MLLLSWYLLSRATAAQQKQQQGTKQLTSSSTAGSGVAVISPAPLDSSSIESASSSSWLSAAAGGCRAAREALSQPGVLLAALLWQPLSLLIQVAALLDLLLVLLLGGRWVGGVGAWEAAGLFLRGRAWRLLLSSSSAAGAAFIKWGQWSSSRPDIFPEDFCDTMAALHDKAPVHSFRHTRKTVEAAFGKTLEELFDQFDQKPLASGSIAQAAAGLAAGHDDEVVEVVVKVSHPNVQQHICMDFRLLAGLSAAAARVPALRGLSLRESVAQFSHTMTAQTDLRVEGVHALRFSKTSQVGVASSVQIPRPIPGLVSQQALVETYEPGLGVAKYMKRRTPINAHIVGLGVDAFLKMLLVDNFVHTDLHPGNILFRAQLAGGGSSDGQTALKAQLVLLDFGLAEELTDEVRHHFISFLSAISAGDGACAARHLLRWSRTQACEDPRGFTADVMDLFSERCQIHSDAGIDLDGVMKAVLGLARKWGVSIDSCYASLVISVCVLVGFAQALDPGVNIMDAATPGLLAYSLTGKVLGRLYS